MRKYLLVLIVLLAASVAAAGTPRPGMGLRDVVEVWLAAAVRVGGTPEAPVLIDCFDGAAERVPAEYRGLVRALEPISGYLVAELGPEMEVGLHDAATFRAMVLAKSDWSPAVVELVRAALKEAGIRPVGFPVASLALNVGAETQGCTTGRCDCVPCAPRVKCDCKTAPLDKNLDCYGPRSRCSISAPAKVSDLEFNLGDY